MEKFTFKINNPKQRARSLNVLNQLIKVEGKTMSIYEWLESLPKDLKIETIPTYSRKLDKDVMKTFIGGWKITTKTEADYYTYLKNGGSPYSEYKKLELEKFNEERKIKLQKQEEESRKRQESFIEKQNRYEEETNKNIIEYLTKPLNTILDEFNQKHNTLIEKVKDEVKNYLKSSNVYDDALEKADQELKNVTFGNVKEMGLVNDETRRSEAYKIAKRKYDYVFKMVREFNKTIPNNIKREASELKREEKYYEPKIKSIKSEYIKKNTHYKYTNEKIEKIIDFKVGDKVFVIGHEVNKYGNPISDKPIVVETSILKINTDTYNRQIIIVDKNINIVNTAIHYDSVFKKKDDVKKLIDIELGQNNAKEYNMENSETIAKLKKGLTNKYISEETKEKIREKIEELKSEKNVKTPFEVGDKVRTYDIPKKGKDYFATGQPIIDNPYYDRIGVVTHYQNDDVVVKFSNGVEMGFLEKNLIKLSNKEVTLDDLQKRLKIAKLMLKKGKGNALKVKLIERMIKKFNGKKKYKKGGKIVGIDDIENKEMFRCFTALENDLMNGEFAIENKVIDSSRNLVCYFRKENFSDVEKYRLNRELQKYIDKRVKPDFCKIFDRFEIKENKIYFYTKEKIYKKGGSIGKSWIAEAEKEIEKKGTKGLFRRRAEKRGMSTVDFAKDVLSNKNKYREKVIKEAQYFKNINPKLFM